MNSIEQNKQIVRRIPDEIYNQGKLNVVDEIVAPDYVTHMALPSGFPAGRESIKAFASMIRMAFPDCHFSVETLIAEGDKVVCHLTARGTHQGAFIGIPATNRQVTWTESHICRMENGKMVEHWASRDQMGLINQLR